MEGVGGRHEAGIAVPGARSPALRRARRRDRAGPRRPGCRRRSGRPAPAAARARGPKAADPAGRAGSWRKTRQRPLSGSSRARPPPSVPAQMRPLSSSSRLRTTGLGRLAGSPGRGSKWRQPLIRPPAGEAERAADPEAAAAVLEQGPDRVVQRPAAVGVVLEAVEGRGLQAVGAVCGADPEATLAVAAEHGDHRPISSSPSRGSKSGTRGEDAGGRIEELEPQVGGDPHALAVRPRAGAPKGCRRRGPRRRLGGSCAKPRRRARARKARGGRWRGRPGPGGPMASARTCGATPPRSIRSSCWRAGS